MRPLRTDGTVLITGGLGELGLLVARSLSKRGFRRLVLTGRRGLTTPGATEAVAELEALGAKVTVAGADIADREALARIIDAIDPEAPLRGVVHAAGILDIGLLAQLTAERMSTVMTAKVAGALHLDALTQALDLDFFVLFSSLAGAVGVEGQGPYAAANTFLDGIAARRQAGGRVGLSLAWGLWGTEAKGAGLAASLSQEHVTGLASAGFGALSPTEGIALFEHALSRPEAHLVPTSFHEGALRRNLGENVPPFWRLLFKEARRRGQGSQQRSSVDSWKDELARMAPEQRRAAVLAGVTGEVARLLALSHVPADKPFKEMGLDSLMAVALRNALGKRVGATLPVTFVFDHPSALAVTTYLLERVLGLDSREAHPEAVPDVVIASEALTIDEVAQMSDEQAVARLSAELSNLLETL